jgi:archaellum biogenesis ATPase FlaH
MVNIEGIVLYKLLEEQSLSAFADLKSCFFSGAYTPIYRLIHKFYIREGIVPSFESLLLVTKDARSLNSLYALQTLEVPDVELDLAVSALIDQYAQNEALTAIDAFIDKVTFFDVTEIKEGIGEILLDLDSKLDTEESIMTADQFTVFKNIEETDKGRIASGISNWYDAHFGGLFLEELVLVGGKKGSGKSIVCANLAVAQYEAGFVVPYYTIEMTGDETFMRIMCMLAKVDFNHCRNNRLSVDEVDRLAKVRAGMFVDGDKYYESFATDHKDAFRLEKELKQNTHLHPDNQIIIIDDRDLSITKLDLSMQKLKAQYKDNIKLILIDYMNQITMGGNVDSMYDWKDQVSVSKQVKNLARKYKCAIVSPYQIDDTGATRFARGILDSCDVALLLDSKKVPDSLVYTCAKARSGSDTFSFRTSIAWSYMRTDPSEIPLEPEVIEGEEEETKEVPWSAKKKKQQDRAVLTGVGEL